MGEALGSMAPSSPSAFLNNLLSWAERPALLCRECVQNPTFCITGDVKMGTTSYCSLSYFPPPSPAPTTGPSTYLGRINIC